MIRCSCSTLSTYCGSDSSSFSQYSLWIQYKKIYRHGIIALPKIWPFFPTSCIFPFLSALAFPFINLDRLFNFYRTFVHFLHKGIESQKQTGNLVISFLLFNFLCHSVLHVLGRNIHTLDPCLLCLLSSGCWCFSGQESLFGSCSLFSLLLLVGGLFIFVGGVCFFLCFV